MNAHSGVAVSAPGKVLITGGYLVLDRAYRGLVLGTDARFYAAVKSSVNAVPRSSEILLVIYVTAPQFTDAHWKYTVVRRAGNDHTHDWQLRVHDNAASSEKTAEETVGRNPFVEAALRLVLAYAQQAIGAEQWARQLALHNTHDIHVTMQADNDFYSQRQQLAAHGLPITRQRLAELPRFCPTEGRLRDVHKTGLGSSAALTTALVAALLAYFGVIDQQQPLTAASRRLVHNLAQVCHCYAQGKVGSGFDVSSAVSAGHAYRRFSPSVLTSFLSTADEGQQQRDIYALAVDATRRWDGDEVVPFHLPPGFVLVLADVDAGSHTPSMVSKVLAWKKREPQQAETLWSALNGQNERVLQLMAKLQQHSLSDRAEYDHALSSCRSLSASQWQADKTESTTAVLVDLYHTYQAVRKLMKEMGEYAGVPIEPDAQTQLLDACLAVPGILMAGVPGAGGDDAVFCVALDKAALHGLEAVWSSWSEARVTPLLCTEATSGLRFEDCATLS